jgi:carboxypeptidase T
MKHIILALAFISTSVFARNMHLVEFVASSPQERSLIGNIIHLDGMNGDTVFSMINDHDLQQVQAYIPFLLSNITTIEINETSSTEEQYPEGDEKFYTYEEMKQKFEDLEKNHPEFVRMISIGQSFEGRELYALHISEHGNKVKKPGILITGSHHAREHLSTDVPVRIAEKIIMASESDRIKNLIRNRDIYFLPMVNPDGAMWDIRGRNYKIWRKNMRSAGPNAAYGVDLNRNYSHGWGGPGSSDRASSDIYRGSNPFSEPETKAIKTFIEAHDNINVLLSFHSFSELILYPWGNTTAPLPSERDRRTYEVMAEEMSKWNNYRPMQASELYVASGDTCDWAWAEHRIFCFTFELSPQYQWGPGGFYPGARAIDPAVKDNYDPVLYLIEVADNPYKVID